MSTLKVNTIDAHSGSLLTIDSTADLVVASTTAASSSTTGALRVVGGISTTNNLYVGGNAVITGTMTANGGTITLGDAGTDNVTIGGEINSDIIPDATNTYDLGSSSKKWAEIHATDFTGDLAGNVVGNVTGNVVGNVTGNTSGSAGSTTGNSATASAWATARTLALTGAVTGSASVDGSGNVSMATTATADPTLTLSGDASGSATFTNLGNATLAVTVTNDSHTHAYSNLTGTPATFVPTTENVQDIAGAMFSGNTESGITATYQDGDGTIDLNVNDPTVTLSGAVTGLATMTNLGDITIATTATSDPTVTLTGAVTGAGTLTNLGDVTITTTATADPTITLGGDLSGSVTLTNLGNGTLTATVADDSHNHVIGNVDGLQAALDLKATLASPTLTGAPIAPTAAANTNTTQIATTAYVQTEITDLIDGAPGTLDTLNELAAAINDDSSYSSTLTTALATKTAKTSNQSLGSAANVMTISGHTITLARGDSTTDTVTVPDNNTTYSVGDGGLTQINFTSADNTKLDGIATSANNYSHPTSFAGDDISVDTGALSGAVVISDLDFNVTTDTAGHVTDANGTVSTRTLTLANLGYTGATNANYITNNSSLTNGAGYITGYTNTTYSPGAGLDLSGTTFSIESDLRDNVQYVGRDTNDYMYQDGSNFRFFINGGERARMVSNGDFHADGDVIAYSTTISDERLKTGIMPIPNALEKVNQLTGCTFTYLSDGRKSAGLIAQDVEKVLPSAVSEKELPLKMDDGEKYKVLQYDQTIGLLVEAIKELSAKVEKLEEK